MPPTAEMISATLNAEREAFRAFIAARVASKEDAEDILQGGMIQAFRHAGEVEPGKATAWFYRILRNAIIDHYRRQASGKRKTKNLEVMLNALEEDVAAAPEWERRICGCMDGIVAGMPERQADLIRLVDLEGMSVTDAAKKLKVTANSASVTLHRARKELRVRLERFCGACADGACLDCGCQPEKS